jgi:hypothetical protein
VEFIIEQGLQRLVEYLTAANAAKRLNDPSPC